MRPESAQYLEKARQTLGEARAIAGIELAEAAGRAAYLSAFHAAQALIFERSGRVPTTHRGLHAQFARLVKDEAPFAELTRFLSQAYDFKAIADYEIGPEAILPLAEALAAIDTAERFVDRIAELLAEC